MNKYYCVVYETLTDVMNDESIHENTIVFTLGKEKINDGDGGLYKILTKDEVGLKRIDGVPFPKKSRFYAMKIKLNNN